MCLRVSLTCASVYLLLGGVPACADGALRRYLAGTEAAAEEPEVRASLESLAARLDELARSEGSRLCATALSPWVRDLETRLDGSGRAALRSVAAGLLARPTLDTFYDAPLAPFRVHYSVVGPNAVLGATTDTAADGRPRYVHTAALALTRAWEALIDSLGYPGPLSDSAVGGGLDRYDCYLAQTGFSNVIGFTSAETWYGKPVGGDTIRIATSYQVVHPTMAPFPQVSDPFDLLRITCAHEFFHAIHFTYDLDEKPDWQTAGWWLEGTAVWFEDYAFPQVDDWSNLPFYLNAPERSITDSPNLSDLHPYGGGSMWAFYLVERYGGPGILKDIWDRCGLDSADNTLAATDSVLVARGTSLDLAWSEFASWCMRTGNRWDATSFSQGAAWPKASPVTVQCFYPSAVHFSDGVDTLTRTLAPAIPVTTITSGGRSLASLGFAPIAHIPLPTGGSGDSLSMFVNAAPGLPVSFSYLGLDTTSGSVGVISGPLPLGDTTVIGPWLNLDTLFVVASSGVHFAPGDSVGDPLADVTAILTAALDSVGALANTASFVQPFPNPYDSRVDPSVRFTVALSEAGQVDLDIFTVSGDRVRSVSTTGAAQCTVQLLWDGTNERGQRVGGGLYLCKVTVELSPSGAREEKFFRVGVVR